MAISFNENTEALVITDDETGATIASLDIGMDGSVELTTYEVGNFALDEHEVESLREWLTDV